MERLAFDARLRLLPTSQGGRSGPIFGDYRPSWNLGNTWLGQPTINDARVLLDAGVEIRPGEEAIVQIEPLAPEYWGRVRPGVVIPMQEGASVKGYASIVGIAAQPEWFTPAVADFVDQARQFREFVEKANEAGLEKRLVNARVRLLHLYEAGSRLPNCQPPEGFEAGPSPEPPKDWSGFERYDAYWEVFDPYEEEAPVGGSLSDDVLDVFRDVMRGLQLWDRKGVPKSAAIWEWRFHFDQHWGDHAIDALRALHRACGAASSGSEGQVP